MLKYAIDLYRWVLTCQTFTFRILFRVFKEYHLLVMSKEWKKVEVILYNISIKASLGLLSIRDA